MSDPNSVLQEQQHTDVRFDDLLQEKQPEAAPGTPFTVGFRGYDRIEVDDTIKALNKRLSDALTKITQLEASNSEVIGQFQAQIDQLKNESASVDPIKAELAAKSAKVNELEEQLEALTAQLIEGQSEDSETGTSTREQFEAVLRVAEEQADTVIHNASIQAERLLLAAKEEVASQKAEAQADAARITEQAQHDADQVHLRIDTEYTAHETTIQREATHAEEKVAQAEREAETIRSEAEKGAATLRAMVTRETEQLRADTERDVREMNARLLEFEETLTRRQDDAQQEFLVLHNQAVAHAERITADANKQVESSLEHAKLISAKADDYEKLMRAQAAQIEAEAQVKAQQTLDRARTKAQKIVSAVADHTTGVLRDAEDRTRQLRWQQQQLSSFMSEVRELIRPDGIFSSSLKASDEAVDIEVDLSLDASTEENQPDSTTENRSSTEDSGE